jgi:hypothetical protein
MASLWSGRPGFWIKLVIAVAFVALADAFFYGGHIGSTLGVFALMLVCAIVAVHPAVRRDPRARIAAALAGMMAMILLDAPSLQVWMLYWALLAVVVLSPRAAAGLDAWAWSLRLGYLAAVGTIGPVLDGLKMRGRLGLWRGAAGRTLATVAAPAIGGAVFLALFASANPVIDQALSGIRMPAVDIARALFWLFCLVGVWSFLRPRFRRRRRERAERTEARPIPGTSVASVGLSLGVFNALFALQNGLDIAFLWSGAALPKGVTLAEYAHRGAYPLIVTALLAGVFVLVALRPGSPSARRPWLRGLVVLWVAQNVFLVASSILRTLDYIQAYSMTRLRIAALLWMGLVAFGLVLICWRMLRGKSSGRLINANVMAAGVVLAGCGVVDLGAIAARWNVDHAREVGGDGPPLDLCYLALLHGASAAPLSELERRPLSPGFRDRVAWVRFVTLTRLNNRQADWRDWTWRGSRELEDAERLYPFPPSAPATPSSGTCHGGSPPPPPAASRPSPPRALTGKPPG